MIDFSKLIPLYLEPHRHYHNLQHIHAMLRELHDIRFKIKPFNWYHVTMAIWYHDAYYDPLAPDGLNEIMSRDLYISHHGLTVPEVTDSIEHLIMSTGCHAHTQKVTEVNQIFLDLDMHFMGLGPVRYNRNIMNIEREYLDAGISFEQYRKGRVIFLKSLLERYKNDDSIFYTDYFREKYSGQAKINILTELNTLVDP